MLKDQNNGVELGVGRVSLVARPFVAQGVKKPSAAGQRPLVQVSPGRSAESGAGTTPRHAPENKTRRTEVRKGAVRVLTRVLSENVTLEDALNAERNGLLGVSLSSAENLPQRGSQMAWLQEICSGTLRWKGRLDLAIDSVALKKKPSGWLRKVLLLASYQIIVQRSAHEAVVVDETVSLVKEREGEAPARFANALLRKLSSHHEQWKDLPFGPQVQKSEQEFKEGSLWASIPSWLWRRLVVSYGLQWSEAFARASLERPGIWLRSNPKAKDSLKEMVEKQVIEQGPVPHSWRLNQGGRVQEVPGYVDGSWIVQDISSQILVNEMTAQIRSNIGTSEKKLRVLDLCAAPGGKSIGLNWSQLDVVATDRMEKRMAILQDSVSRTQASVQLASWEDVQPGTPKFSEFDWIWIDAPCTGSGIIRRHPDVRWIRQEKDLLSLVKTQKTLLQDAITHAAPGTFLSYSVCSVLKEEGPEILEELSNQMGKALEVVQQWSLVPQTAPYGDGFWGVLLRKV